MEDIKGNFNEINLRSKTSSEDIGKSIYIFKSLCMF